MGVDLIGVDLAAASRRGGEHGSAGFRIPLRSGQLYQLPQVHHS